MKKISLILTIVCIIVFAILAAQNLSIGNLFIKNFKMYLVTFIKLLPPIFVILGLCEVWIKQATVEKHLGSVTNWKAYVWVLLLAGTTVGGIYVAFPIAQVMYKKGANLAIIFTYLGFAGICRIPMTIFEATFLGIKFTILRLLVSIPLVIITSVFLGNYLTKRNYRLSLL